MNFQGTAEKKGVKEGKTGSREKEEGVKKWEKREKKKKEK